jgi:hypothetical protein
VGVGQRAEVATHLNEGLVALAPGRFRRDSRQPGAFDHGIRPDVEPRFVLQRHAEQPADRGDREWVCEFIHQIDLALAGETVDQVADDLQKLRPHPIDPVGCLWRTVVTVEDAPDAVVVRRVLGDQALHTLPPGADPRVVQQFDDVPVPTDDVRAVGLPHHRCLPQLSIQAIGIGPVGVVKNLLEDAGRCHGGSSGSYWPVFGGSLDG